MKPFKCSMVIGMLFLMAGCPPLSMEPVWLDLKFINQSDTKLKLLLNISYPDTSLKGAGPDVYVDPKETQYPGKDVGLKNDTTIKGITLFVFDYDYYYSQWNEKVGTPDTFLDEDSVLKKYIHTKEELDSLGWILYYP